MLAVGRDRLIDKGVTDVPVMRMDAQHLPFADASLDRVIIGFGLRNVTDKDMALAEMRRVETRRSSLGPGVLKTRV